MSFLLVRCFSVSQTEPTFDGREHLLLYDHCLSRASGYRFGGGGK